jgi:hypothetical protein
MDLSSDVEFASLIIGGTKFINRDDGDATAPSATGDSNPSKGRKANPVPPTPARAKIGLVRGLAFFPLTTCTLSGFVAMLLLLTGAPRTPRGEFHGTTIEEGASWANTRWRPSSVNDDENCPPGYRLANATIHCGINDLSPLYVSSDGKRYCGGVPMQPSYCTLPTAGGWDAPKPSSGEGESIQRPLPLRLGIHRREINFPRCKTIGEFVNGSYEGVGFDQEWVPKSCSAVPLSPYAWTENTKCQATVTMVVSIITSSPQSTNFSI